MERGLEKRRTLPPPASLSSAGGRFARFLGWNFVRIAAAVVLLTAAALKTHQLATEPIVGTSILDSRWLLMATVEFELFFGLWLLSGLLPKQTRMAAVGCFAAFTCVSLYKAISGEASCGCFGRVPVNPWITTILDVAIVLSLLRWRPSTMSSPLPLGEGQGEGNPKLPSPSSWRRAGGEGWFSRFPLPFGEGQGEGVSISSARLTLVTVLWLAVGLPAAYAMGSYADTTLSDAGEIIGDGKIVVLKPETWTGKKFPLLGHIDIGDRLNDGLWLVLLHRHNCSACREAAKEYEALAKEFSAKPNCPSIALIECSARSRDTNATTDSNMVNGRMDNEVEWQLSGPTSLLLDGGHVRNVFTNARDVELFKAIWGSGEERVALVGGR